MLPKSSAGVWQKDNSKILLVLTKQSIHLILALLLLPDRNEVEHATYDAKRHAGRKDKICPANQWPSHSPVQRKEFLGCLLYAPVHQVEIIGLGSQIGYPLRSKENAKNQTKALLAFLQQVAPLTILDDKGR